MRTTALSGWRQNLKTFSWNEDRRWNGELSCSARSSLRWCEIVPLGENSLQFCTHWHDEEQSCYREQSDEWYSLFLPLSSLCTQTPLIHQSINNKRRMQVKYSVLKISASRQYVQNCREFSPSGTISHHLRLECAHLSEKRDALHSKACLHFIWKFWDSVSSQTAQWSSWVRRQVLKYCLDLFICLFIFHTPFVES